MGAIRRCCAARSKVVPVEIGFMEECDVVRRLVRVPARHHKPGIVLLAVELQLDECLVDRVLPTAHLTTAAHEPRNHRDEERQTRRAGIVPTRRKRATRARPFHSERQSYSQSTELLRVEALYLEPIRAADAELYTLRIRSETMPSSPSASTAVKNSGPFPATQASRRERSQASMKN